MAERSSLVGSLISTIRGRGARKTGVTDRLGEMCRFESEIAEQMNHMLSESGLVGEEVGVVEGRVLGRNKSCLLPGYIVKAPKGLTSYFLTNSGSLGCDSLLVELIISEDGKIGDLGNMVWLERAEREFMDTKTESVKRSKRFGVIPWIYYPQVSHGQRFDALEEIEWQLNNRQDFVGVRV